MITIAAMSASVLIAGLFVVDERMNARTLMPPGLACGTAGRDGEEG